MIHDTPFQREDYAGGKSTLCTGCGHDQITSHIITALYELGIDPFDVIKVSGIGCSSKIPGYFLSKSQGINSMHGRMAPIATGAQIANKNLKYLGISGDGDTASIGLGGFAHLIRRNLNIVYIVANNGVYGLTKGQFSPTADIGSRLKSGQENSYQEIDVCSLAIDLDCSFVARAFSSNAKEVVSLLKAAIQHQGTALIDIISPCITFNNHDGSTKSYEYVKEHNLPLMKQIPADAHNIHDRIEAMKLLYHARDNGEIITGLFYINNNREHLTQFLNLPEIPLTQLTETELRPSALDFKNYIKSFT